MFSGGMPGANKNLLQYVEHTAHKNERNHPCVELLPFEMEECASRFKLLERKRLYPDFLIYQVLIHPIAET